MYRVVDTNVLIVANHKAPQASLECVLSCVEYLNNLRKSDILVIDSDWLIIGEYRRKNSESGQPGVGDAFLKWMLTNRTNPKHCEQVHITQLAENDFAEFPRSPSLAGFDPSDRKFVAVALTHPQRPAIANAVDSDWRNYESALAQQGIKVDFLCAELRPKD
ncbi:MAG: type II toxin-antitoxin system VapC family toxin [Pseudanabaena sp. CRU_2_10]|nr:type II toxin-antitoxin system VapC family toxin [Pseudanabaena sp. CRU_2_10]